MWETSTLVIFIIKFNKSYISLHMKHKGREKSSRVGCDNISCRKEA